MAGIDAYSPCPCGSGEKYKWCCQKVEAFTDKAQRLYDGGQSEAAIDSLKEGLKKHSGNAWLMLRKAVYEIREERPTDAAATLRSLLESSPNHLAARMLLARSVLETEGPVSASAHLQNAIGLAQGADRSRLGVLYRMVGMIFSRIGQIPAALKHLQLADLLQAEVDPETGEVDPFGSRETDSLLASEASVFLKFPYPLDPTPAGLSPTLAARFDEALEWAEAGFWNSAAAAFETLSGEGAGTEADYNLGVLRLWTADYAGAVEALRRVVAKKGNSTEAIDLEALCYLIEPDTSDGKVDRVKLIWPLKNRDALLDKLRARADVFEEGPGPLEPDDPKSPEAHHFLLLDRPKLPPGDGKNLTTADLPQVLCDVFVGKDIAGIETNDGPDLTSIAQRFTALAVPAIPPAHPKTKIIGETGRRLLALFRHSHYPDGIDPKEHQRLEIAERFEIFEEVWSKWKSAYFGNRTPLEAAKSGDCEVRLRAAVNGFELAASSIEQASEHTLNLRKNLGLPDEPEIDPATVDLDRLHYARYRFVPVEKLDDARLIQFYRNAAKAGLATESLQACLRLADLPELRRAEKIPTIQILGELALQAANQQNRDEAMRWIAQGRLENEVDQNIGLRVTWDMYEIRVLMMLDLPESWVPELIGVMGRYQGNREADQPLLLNLIATGLIAPFEDSNRSGEVGFDTRILQALLSQYGPRVASSSGHIGVSATRPEVWTPDAAAVAGGSTTPGGIWTPGSGGVSGGGEKPKLIIPGR